MARSSVERGIHIGSPTGIQVDTRSTDVASNGHVATGGEVNVICARTGDCTGSGQSGAGVHNNGVTGDATSTNIDSVIRSQIDISGAGI